MSKILTTIHTPAEYLGTTFTCREEIHRSKHCWEGKEMSLKGNVSNSHTSRVSALGLHLQGGKGIHRSTTACSYKIVVEISPQVPQSTVITYKENFKTMCSVAPGKIPLCVCKNNKL